MSVSIINRMTGAKHAADQTRRRIARFVLTEDDWDELEVELRELETVAYSGDVTSFLGIPVKMAERGVSHIVIEEKVTL